MYKLGNRVIKDECAECGEILNCELCKDGHGVFRDRTRITELIKCQMEHEHKRSLKDNG